MVCRQLGFSGADRYLTASSFGSVPNRFSYDEVVCNGNESSVQECQHQDHDDCYPDEGAGVICTV